MSSRFAALGTALLLGALTACSAGTSSTTPVTSGGGVQMMTLASGEHIVRIGARQIRWGGPRTHVAETRSWIEPARHHRKKALLYGASYDGGFVNIYREKGTHQSPIGHLGGMTSPQGIVVDTHHQIWVANTNAFNIFAFKRGATKPFATLSDPGYYPVSIAVDGNGTVYAANAEGTSGQAGNVTFWKSGSSNPSGTLTDSTMQLVLGIGVDASANVYITYIPKSGPPAVMEFPAGSSTGQILPMSDTTISDITFDSSSNLVMEDGSGGLGIWAPPYSGNPSRTISAFGNEPTLNKSEGEVWIAYANPSEPMIESYSYSSGNQLDVISNGWTPQHAIPYGVAVDPPAPL